LFDIKIQYQRHIHLRAKAVDLEANIRYTGNFIKPIKKLCWTPKRRQYRRIQTHQEPKEKKKEEARKVDANWKWAETGG